MYFIVVPSFRSFQDYVRRRAVPNDPTPLRRRRKRNDAVGT
jgi:hypothetical protein